jgi:antitoxin component of RelBE/YafQ-DinJ toxin-antitoxin module
MPIRTPSAVSRKKLTLSVEERLTRRAKAIAKKRGTSVSRLVETFFTALEQEGGDAFEVEQTHKRGKEKPSEDSEDSFTTDYEPSDWARQWRGAFAEEGKTYPDDPSWEREVLAEEIEKKHAS